MAKYICFSHKTPRVFRNRRGLYGHLILKHRDCFSSVPDNFWSDIRTVDFSKFTCRKCGKCGFKGLLDLVRHLNKCQGLKIIYQRKIARPVVFSNGLPKNTATKIMESHRTMRDVALKLEVPKEILDLAEDLSEKYCREAGVGRTIYIDAASLYIASMLKGCEFKISQCKIASEFNISELALRENYKKIMKTLNIEKEI